MDPKVVREISLAYQAVYDQELREEFEEKNYQNQVDEVSFEIFESISHALISQGYGAVDVLQYFANVDEEVIIEDITNLSNGTLMIESVVSNQYILEQYEILNEALPALASGAALAGRALLGSGARRVAGTVLKRMAGPGVRKALGSAKNVVTGAVGKLKGVARGALNKLPGGAGGKLASGLKTGAKWALGGAAFEAGARGLRGLMGNKGTPSTQAKPKPTADKSKYNASAALGGQTAFKAGGGAAAMKKNPKLTAADIQKRGNAALRASGGGDLKKGADLFTSKQKANTPTPPKPSTPAPTTTSRSTSTSSPKPKPTVKPTVKPSEGSGSKITDMGKRGASPSSPSIKDKFPSTNSLGGSDIDKPKPTTKPAEPVNKATGSKKPGSVYSGFDMFDLIKGHLLDEGYADTEEAAIAIMANMSEEWRQSIIG
jgi:hypothetical protein